MIQGAYVSFELAKLLKKRGFDELCVRQYYTYWGEGGELKNYEHPVIEEKMIRNSQIIDGDNATAPTQQMVMSWLREVHKLYIEPFSIKDYDKKKVEYTYSVQDLGFPGSDDGIDTCKTYDTHEEAVEAAIKYCLEKLI